jgi:plastocyanin
MKKYMCAFVLGLSLISPSAWADQTIEIKDHLFAPENVTVAVGTKVTWINHDQDPHTVVDRSKKFNSGAMDTNDSFSYTFTEPGTYKYFCTLHPMMVGKIIVTVEK